MSEDPRRYRERVIFYHHEVNYLLKVLWDCNFLKDTVLGKYLVFARHYDPFILKPVMLLEAKGKGKMTEEEVMLLEMIKPGEQEMGKIVQALIVLAEEEYDEDQQTRFVNEKKNYGELEWKKRTISQRRDSLGSRVQSYS